MKSEENVQSQTYSPILRLCSWKDEPTFAPNVKYKSITIFEIFFWWKPLRKMFQRDEKRGPGLSQIYFSRTIFVNNTSMSQTLFLEVWTKYTLNVITILEIFFWRKSLRKIFQGDGAMLSRFVSRFFFEFSIKLFYCSTIPQFVTHQYLTGRVPSREGLRTVE